YHQNWLSSFTVMDRYFKVGSGYNLSGSGGSAAWPANNRAIYVPFELDHPMLVVRMWVFNGGTTSGNLDVGLYSADGTRLVSAGSTAQSGTSQIQMIDITDTMLDRGAFYMALSSSTTSATFMRFNGGAANDWLLWGGLQEGLGSVALPATATFASNQT